MSIKPKKSSMGRGASPEILEKTSQEELRPASWGEYVGQERTKENLRILLSAAKSRGHAPEHILFYGPPGLGKTTLAYLIAKETGSQIKITSGAAIEKVGDLASILTNLSPKDVLFIDEIHRLNKSIEEILYPAMESGKLDIIIGKGPSARTIQLELPPFTLVAATTKMAMLSAPLRSRFSGGTFRLEFYSDGEIERILERSAKVLKIKPAPGAIKAIATRSRATPRAANFILKRVRDYVDVGKNMFDGKAVEETLKLLEIDDLGLNSSDRRILETIVDKFKGGPVGLSTIAAALAEETSTVEDVHEPYLMRLGLIERTPRGRVVTERGEEHIGRGGIKKNKPNLF